MSPGSHISWAEYERRLAEYDEALAAGEAEFVATDDALSAPEELAVQLREAKECLLLLERCWPRRAAKQAAQVSTDRVQVAPTVDIAPAG